MYTSIEGNFRDGLKEHKTGKGPFHFLDQQAFVNCARARAGQERIAENGALTKNKISYSH
jgi:hypothetical protein